MKLVEKQQQPLWWKINESLRLIHCWYESFSGEVYVAFSGGFDSTVLLHLVRMIHPDVPAVFCDTGLEFPEIREFVKTVDNVVWLRPNMPFHQVIEKYGYPVISKDQATAISRFRNTKDYRQKLRRLYGWPQGKKGTIARKWHRLIFAPFKIGPQCCRIMKKSPMKKYAKESGRMPLIGSTTEESYWRKRFIQKCNNYDAKKPQAYPIAFWSREDVWAYVEMFNVSYSKIYDMGEKRTGCMFCMFGVHLEDEPNRFQRMKITHPKLWKYCIYKLNLKQVLDYIDVPYE